MLVFTCLFVYSQIIIMKNIDLIFVVSYINILHNNSQRMTFIVPRFHEVKGVVSGVGPGGEVMALCLKVVMPPLGTSQDLSWTGQSICIHPHSSISSYLNSSYIQVLVATCIPHTFKY